MAGKVCIVGAVILDNLCFLAPSDEGAVTIVTEGEILYTFKVVLSLLPSFAPQNPPSSSEEGKGVDGLPNQMTFLFGIYRIDFIPKLCYTETATSMFKKFPQGKHL